jgi:hypothetical protein
LRKGSYCTKEVGSGNIITDLYLEGIGLNLGWETIVTGFPLFSFHPSMQMPG